VNKKWATDTGKITKTVVTKRANYTKTERNLPCALFSLFFFLNIVTDTANRQVIRNIKILIPINSRMTNIQHSKNR